MENNQNGGRLAGKVAIVTGALGGIGTAIARRLGADGAAVVVHYAHGAENAKEVVEDIRGAGGKARAAQADLNETAEVHGLFEDAETNLGRPDILVNNAGEWTFTPIDDITEEEFDQTFSLNTRGTFFAIQEAARRINHGGRIVNVSTASTDLAPETQAVYVGSKAAIEGFTRVAAKELGQRGITVNAVSPGATNTEQFQQTVPEEEQEQMSQGSVFGRLGEPEDIAAAVAFLASEEAAWITGSNISASGGLAS